VELVRSQFVCPCQRCPPLDIGRIHCEKYASVFISIPINIKVALTVRYGQQVAFGVLQFSCRPCEIPKSHLQVVMTKGKGGGGDGTITRVRLCGMFSSFLVVSFDLSIVKKNSFDQAQVTPKLRISLVMKAKRMHYFSNLFDKVLYMFRTCPLSIIRSIGELYTRKKYLSC